MAEFDSREKKPFSSCVQRVGEETLRQLVCLEDRGEPSIQPEAERIISECADRDSLRTDDFGHSLSLNRDEVSAAIRAAPRNKEQQMRQAVIAWSRNQRDEATLEKLLEALYIRDEVELVEDICQRLSQTRISDDRKIHPGGEDVTTLPNPVHVQAVPLKEVHEEEVMTPTSFEPENGAPFLKPVRVSSSGSLKPGLHRPSSSEEGVVNPVSATEQGGSLSAMAWPTSHFIPSGMLHDKTASSSGPVSIQEENGALRHSVTVQGGTSSSKLSLAARMDEMELRMREMGEELRREDAKMKLEIEELKRELLKRDTEIRRLKVELELETEQKHDVERQLVSERQDRQQAEASNDELQRSLEELYQQLQERDAELEELKRKKSARDSVDDIDHQDDSAYAGEDDEAYVASSVYSDEELSPVLQWKLEETTILGCGNFGIVFKGHCEDTGRELAVKVVRDINDKTVKSLELEYDMLSKLRHKRIVSYLGASRKPHPNHGKECLFVMTEFMAGGTLADYYNKRGALNETLTRRYTRQIVQGVEYLHGRQIIHRDLKGSNIMRNTRGQIKLADFGCAKEIFADTSEKRTSYLYGTAPWAAPEVLRSETAHCKSDIWSVAATVVEMMTAERPYKSNPGIKNNNAIVYLVGMDKLNPLQSVSMKKLVDDKEVSQDAIAFLTECFKSAVDDRPSATDLLSSFKFCKKS